MNVQDFLENFESLPTFPGIKANSTVFAWWVNRIINVYFRSLILSVETTNRQCHLEVGALPTFKKLSR